MIRKFFNRFRKPKPPNDDWSPGDLAECILDGWHGGLAGPKKGEINRVVSVSPHRCVCGCGNRETFMLGFARFGPSMAFNCHSFRKITPRADEQTRSDAAFTKLIRRLRAPIPRKCMEKHDV